MNRIANGVAALLLGAIATGFLVAPATAQIFVREVARGFPLGLAVRNAGGDDARLFVVSQNGLIRIRAPGASTPRAVPFLHVNTLTGAPPGGTAPPGGFTSGGERGLLGLAFHPQYASNGFFFVYYTDGFGDVRIARYSRSADPNVADAASGVTILRVDKEFSNHNGGDLNFGADGFLYLGTGDGGSGGDPCERAQTLNPTTLINTDNCAADTDFLNSGGNFNSRALAGKMLRIDIDGTTTAGANQLCSSNADGSAPYAVPPSNPFSGNDPQSGCDEIFHYGLRNPFRFSFDRSNGDLFIGDVGQSAQEEISFAGSGVSGVNFGWDICEGTANFEGPCNSPGLTAPILFYTRAANPNACSVTGGYRYRGTGVPALAGRYVYADYCSGQLWAATEQAGGGWTTTSLAPLPAFRTAGFGEDHRGELYIASLGSGAQEPLSIFVGENIFADSFE